eukprot:Gregarina_sp_Poly_1__2386@NODE_163_length_12241_cov_147_232955_g145_i0_p4_GENE_NODE_163_length_12241_cov_147_232955_g145_i0NODE_163_length_12241_cov_147_232955_g145_i0_p4_ORF_typecomplete_len486_score53_05gerPA/PF10676_9/0_45_NODE_163_length_12241_cov_147_232955_g145_i044075864
MVFVEDSHKYRSPPDRRLLKPEFILNLLDDPKLCSYISAHAKNGRRVPSVTENGVISNGENHAVAAERFSKSQRTQELNAGNGESPNISLETRSADEPNVQFGQPAENIGQFNGSILRSTISATPIAFIEQTASMESGEVYESPGSDAGSETSVDRIPRQRHIKKRLSYSSSSSSSISSESSHRERSRRRLSRRMDSRKESSHPRYDKNGVHQRRKYKGVTEVHRKRRHRRHSPSDASYSESESSEDRPVRHKSTKSPKVRVRSRRAGGWLQVREDHGSSSESERSYESSESPPRYRSAHKSSRHTVRSRSPFAVRSSRVRKRVPVSSDESSDLSPSASSSGEEINRRPPITHRRPVAVPPPRHNRLPDQPVNPTRVSQMPRHPQAPPIRSVKDLAAANIPTSAHVPFHQQLTQPTASSGVHNTDDILEAMIKTVAAKQGSWEERKQAEQIIAPEILRQRAAQSQTVPKTYSKGKSKTSKAFRRR